MPSKSYKAKQEFIRDLEENFGESDRWGHFKFTDNRGRQCRVKIQKTSWRFEVMGFSVWTRIISQYFTADLSKPCWKSLVEVYGLVRK